LYEPASSTPIASYKPYKYHTSDTDESLRNVKDSLVEVEKRRREKELDTQRRAKHEPVSGNKY